MGTIFSDTLRRARKEAGFPTAYRFFHDNGGMEALGFTYRQYLRMEQGKNLPSCQKLHKLILALRMTAHSAPHEDLAVAWLKMVTGEEIYNSVFAQLIRIKQPGTGISPMHAAVKSVLRSKKHYITPDEFKIILTNSSTFLCFTALQNDAGLWSTDQVAQSLRLTKPAVHSALKTLAQAKLFKKVKENVYRCPLTSMMIEYPRLELIDPALREKFFSYQRELIDSGSTICGSTGIVRADLQQLRLHYTPLMILTVSTAETYSITEKTDNSGLFYIESRLIKLRDF